MKLACGFALALVLSSAACGGASEEPQSPIVDPAGEPPPGSSTETSTPPGAPPPGSPPVSAPEPLGAPYPVVLLHGMGGFGKLEVGPVELTYFDGVVEDLTKNGESVYVTLAPPYATSEVRAQAIAKQIDTILARTGKKKVNLVGHSQGGLDARVLASPAGLGYGDRIASVTTVATPHRGSRVADAVLGILEFLPEGQVDQLTKSVLELLQRTAYDLQSDSDLRAQLTLLSEKHMRDVFNPKYVDDPKVVYMSYAGRTNLRTGIGTCDGSVYPNDPTKLDVAQGPLIATAIFLEEGSFKVNDGLVTVASSRWGSFQQCLPADHLKEVGQFGPLASSFDHVKLFRNIVERVRAAGL